MCPHGSHLNSRMFVSESVSTGRDKPGRDVPLSLCPGTRARENVPGQTPLSRDVPGTKKMSKRVKNYQEKSFFSKNVIGLVIG